MNGKENELRCTTSKDWFGHFAASASTCLGSRWAFATAIAIILVWGITGPIYHYSDTWQLLINTGTTIVTFLMVFLIQNTQNRDTEALQIKLDEIIRATHQARNELLDLEEMDDAHLSEIRQRYLDMAENARRQIEQHGIHRSQQ
jgi:low affinity Fe/Cu permease